MSAPVPVDQALLDRVRAVLAQEAGEPTPARVAAALRSEGRLLGDAAVLSVVRRCAGSFRAPVRSNRCWPSPG